MNCPISPINFTPLYLDTGPDNAHIYLKAHEAECAAHKDEDHDGDDLLGGQVRPRDHQLHLLAGPHFLLIHQGVEPWRREECIQIVELEMAK